jgi:hypothetical protein
MTVLSVAQDVCLVIGLKQPVTLMSSTDRQTQELARVARDTASMIASAFDWQRLQKIHTLSGDGASEAFALPSDFDRMLENASMWSSRWTWAFNHIANPDEWLEMQVVPYSFINGNWIVFGGEFHVLPVMAETETLKFYYISNLLVQPEDGEPQETFKADGDTFVLSEKLLEYGMIWKWRENKGLPYDEKKADFDAELAALMRRDAGSRSVVRGTTRVGRGARLAFPQTVGS